MYWSYQFLPGLWWTTFWFKQQIKRNQTNVWFYDNNRRCLGYHLDLYLFPDPSPPADEFFFFPPCVLRSVFVITDAGRESQKFSEIYASSHCWYWLPLTLLARDEASSGPEGSSQFVSLGENRASLTGLDFMKATIFLEVFLGAPSVRILLWVCNLCFSEASQGLSDTKSWRTKSE